MNGLINTSAQFDEHVEPRSYGVSIGYVISNKDLSGQGRVQVHLPFIPEIEPWARVAVPMAGASRGTFFIPQEKDEVLVVFNRGDIREAYIIGSLWNGIDSPPATGIQDPVNKRLIRSPRGHEIELDDALESITVTSTEGHKVTIDPSGIELKTAKGGAKVTLDEKNSKVSIEAKSTISLKASNITIEGKTISIKGSSSVEVKGGQLCNVQAGTVKIN